MNKFTIKNKLLISIIIICSCAIFSIILIIVNNNKENYEFNIGKEQETNDTNNTDIDLDNNVLSKNKEIKDQTQDENYIYIHIIGEVNKTGVLKLKEGTRIVEAIELAEGATANADLNKINLSYVLSDGQQLRIPSIYDKNEDNNYITEGSGKNVIKDGDNINSKSVIKVNINTANQTELETLQGIGPSLARRIIEYREKNGKYKSVEDIKYVEGIGNSKYEGIKEQIMVK